MTPSHTEIPTLTAAQREQVVRLAAEFGVKPYTARLLLGELLTARTQSSERGRTLLLGSREPIVHGPRDALCVRDVYTIIGLADMVNASPMSDPRDLGAWKDISRADVYFWHHEALGAVAAMPAAQWDPKPFVAVWIWDPYLIHEHDDGTRAWSLGLAALTYKQIAPAELPMIWRICLLSVTESYGHHANDPDPHLGANLTYKWVREDDDQYAEAVRSVEQMAVFLETNAPSLTTIGPARQERRRAERVGHPRPSDVILITLRRPQRSTGEDHSDEHRQWSHRWWVSGHWRLQPCGPNSVNRRPTWISNHVKGPPDLPLVAKQHVYDVKR